MPLVNLLVASVMAAAHRHWESIWQTEVSIGGSPGVEEMVCEVCLSGSGLRGGWKTIVGIMWWKGVLASFENLLFPNQNYLGKYERFVGEPFSCSRDKVRTIFGLNEVMSELLWNQLLNHIIDPLMPRTQQVKIILRLEAEAKTRVSTRENIDDTAEHVTAYRI